MNIFKQLFCKHEYREIIRYYKYDLQRGIKAYISEECSHCKKVKIRTICNKECYTYTLLRTLINTLTENGYIDKTFD